MMLQAVTPSWSKVNVIELFNGKKCTDGPGVRAPVSEAPNTMAAETTSIHETDPKPADGKLRCLHCGSVISKKKKKKQLDEAMTKSNAADDKETQSDQALRQRQHEMAQSVVSQALRQARTLEEALEFIMDNDPGFQAYRDALAGLHCTADTSSAPKGAGGLAGDPIEQQPEMAEPEPDAGATSASVSEPVPSPPFPEPFSESAHDASPDASEIVSQPASQPASPVPTAA